MNKFYTAPSVDNTEENKGRRIFLAGTIDMGNSEDWQEEVGYQVIQRSITQGNGIHYIYNPRRIEGFKNEDQEEQIQWELDHLDKADTILMNLLPSSRSPISLLELGLYAKSGKLIVVCPKEFYRYSNVRIICEKYKIPLYSSIGKVRILNLVR